MPMLQRRPPPAVVFGSPAAPGRISPPVGRDIVLLGAAYQVPPLPFTIGTSGAPMLPTPPVTVLSRPGVTIGAPVVVVVDTASALPGPDVAALPPAGGARPVPPMFRMLSGTADIALLFGVVVVTAGLGPLMSTGPGRPPVALLSAVARAVASLPVELDASLPGAGVAGDAGDGAGAAGGAGRAGVAAIRSEFGAAARGVCKPGSDGFTVADVVLVVLAQSLR
jgi:hypothetical protein